jgi:hypothetical protein
VIEGLRIAPWFFDQLRRNPSNMAMLNDCGQCQAQLSELQRQALRCGYLEQVRDGAAWSHRNGPTITTCAGYAAKLPQVIEVIRAHHHWSKGELQSFAHNPSSQMVEGIEILDREMRALEVAIAEDRNK